MGKVKFRNLMLLSGSIISVISAVGIATSMPGISQYFKDVPNSDYLSQLVMTMPSLAIAGSAFFFGYLLDKWGRRPVLILGLILYVIAGTSGYMFDSLIHLLISRVILGFAVSGAMSGITTLLVDYFEGEELNRYMGYQGASLAIGGLLTLVFSGILADIGWRFPFLLHLFGLLILPGVIFAIDEPVYTSSDDQIAGLNGNIISQLGSLTGVYLIAFITMTLIFVFPVQLPFLLTTKLGMSNSEVGLALALQTPLAIILSIYYRHVKARLSFQSIFAIIFLAAGINHIIVAVTDNYWLMLASMLFTGISLGLFPPNLNVWLASMITPGIRGRAVSGLTTFIFLAQFLTPVLTQPIVTEFGIEEVFMYSGFISFLMAGIMIAVNKMKPA